ncbi:uncharacterized protein LOC141590029 [Silene latifolia]|uniref:uncharacterized protein LOC141590029 n=1 Tax=Silene latifolia TaxID=37657 RepID=UPI003D78923C
MGWVGVGVMFDRLRTKLAIVPWFRIIHDKSVKPKHAAIGLLACQNKLPSVDNLQQRGMSLANRCVLCESPEETTSHLFFNCSYSFGIWISVCNRISWQSPPSSLAHMLQWCKHYNKVKARGKLVRRVALVTTLYALWRERNSRIFQGKSTSSSNLSQQIGHSIATRMYHCERSF